MGRIQNQPSPRSAAKTKLAAAQVAEQEQKQAQQREEGGEG